MTRSRGRWCCRMVALGGGLALSIALGPAGCAAPVIVASAGLTVAQYGATSYLNGRLDAARRVPLETVYKAALDAMAPLGFEPTATTEPDENNAYLATRQLNGTSIAIRFTRVSSQVCKVEIRVGVFGDQTLSRLIMSNIDNQLVALGVDPDVIKGSEE